jgi:hypothetical protein
VFLIFGQFALDQQGALACVLAYAVSRRPTRRTASFHSAFSAVGSPKMPAGCNKQKTSHVH